MSAVSGTPQQQQKSLDEQRALAIASQVRSGKFVNMREVGWAAKYYPQVFQTQPREPHGIGPYSGSVDYSFPTPEQQQRQQSQRFYSSIGYSQYGGKYEPFTVPSGYKVKEVSESTSGLNVTFEVVPRAPNVAERNVESVLRMGRLPVPRLSEVLSGVGVPQKGIAETLMTYSFVPLLQRVGVRADISSLPSGKAEEVKPFSIVAGLIAPAEALAYTVGKVAGYKTPDIPPTLVSFQAPQALAYGEKYVFGSLMGEVLLSYGISRAFEATFPKLTSEVAGHVKSGVGRVADVLPSPFPELKETVSNVAGRVGFEFRAHAPQSLLNVVYGKEMGEAVGIERAFSWSKSSVGGTAGMLEETYGMPFYRAETLGMSMPTAEWAGVRATERIVIPRAIEGGWGWESKVLGFAGGQVTETLLPSREAFETSETLKMQMPTRRVADQWYTVTKGSPQTPMEVTLNKAIERGLPTQGRGGLSAVQELVFLHETFDVPSPYSFPSSPTKGVRVDIRPLSYVGSPQLLFAKSGLFGMLGLSTLSSFASGSNVKESTLQIQSVNQLQGLNEVQLQTQRVGQLLGLQQVQTQTQTQIQKQMFNQPTSKTLMPKMDVQFDSDFNRMFRVSKKRKKGGWERMYMWEFPVKGPKAVWKVI